MIHSNLLKLRQDIILYCGDTFTGKGFNSSKNFMKHRAFIEQAKIWGPSYFINIILKAESYFDFTGPPGGIYNQWYLEASEEISLNCIKIMEAYFDGFKSSHQKAHDNPDEMDTVCNRIAVTCDYLLKLKRIKMCDSTYCLYVSLLSSISSFEFSLTGNNDIYRKYEKVYEHYKPYVIHPLLERRRSAKK